MDSLSPTIKNKIIMNTRQHIPPNNFNLIQFIEVPNFLQFLECCIGDASLLAEFYSFHRKTHNLSNKFFYQFHGDPIQSYPIFKLVFKESFCNVRFIPMKSLNVGHHITFVQNFPHRGLSLPSLTIACLLLSWFPSHLKNPIISIKYQSSEN